MNKGFYIKAVVIALKDGMTYSRFLPLVEQLEKAGIVVWTYPAEEGLQQEAMLRESGALYITDCGKKANSFKNKGLPVLGFLHEDGESFSGIDYVMECPEELDVYYLDRVYRRYTDIPWEILETERCLIRETTEEDVDSFFQIYAHPDIVKYTDALNPEKEQERNYIREYIENMYRYFEFGIWTVIWKETGEIIGRAGLNVREGYEFPDLGFVIGLPWQGMGVAYEICKAILQYGKEEFEFECVQALVMPENAASIALCHKLGFVERERVQERQKEYLLMTREL